jgi:hypothetical protein
LDEANTARWILLAKQLDECVTCYGIENIFEQLIKNIEWYNSLNK